MVLMMVGDCLHCATKGIYEFFDNPQCDYEVLRRRERLREWHRPSKVFFEVCVVAGVVASGFALRPGFMLHQCGLVSLLLHSALVEFEPEETYDLLLFETRSETLLSWCGGSSTAKLMIDLPLTVLGSDVVVALCHVPIGGVLLALNYLMLLCIKPYTYLKSQRFLARYHGWQEIVRWTPTGPLVIVFIAGTLVGLSHLISIHAYNPRPVTLLSHVMLLLALLYKSMLIVQSTPEDASVGEVILRRMLESMP